MTRVGAPLLLILAAASALLAGGAPARAMTFEAMRGGACGESACILASGSIDDDTADRFRAYLRRENVRPGEVVILDSEGGDVVQALSLGVEIRKAELSTLIAPGQGPSGVSRGLCASACAYAFMGGVRRSVGEGGKFGVHQMFGRHGELNSSDSQTLVALIAVHFQRLGGSLDLLISALRTPPQKMHWLSANELSRFGVITDGGPADRAGEFATITPRSDQS